MSLRRLRSLLPSLVAALLVAVIVLGGMPPPIAPPAVAGEQQGENRRDVIVVLKRGADPRAIARGAGARPTHLYEHVIDGFAANLPPQAIRGLENHPLVVAVVPDRPVAALAVASPAGDPIAAEVSPAPRKCKKVDNKQRRQQCIKRAKQHERASKGAPALISPPASGSVAPPPVEQPAQVLPTGIDRIDADGNPIAQIDGLDERVDVDVAVLDSGIAAHPDLNVVGGVSCLGASAADDNGHGTHAAGTIGALDNGIGVVGVAPGARLWAVKVLDANGDGWWSSVICGLDWVYANRGTIDVANLSLGGDGGESTCNADPLHGAICRVVNEAGIPVVVAAGNQRRDATTTVPATYQEVIAASAFADSDGAPGGRGPSRCGHNDDRFASFSNFGADVDIAAPGACIHSTSLGSWYTELSGTSMATPHVTGAVALFLAENPAATPVDVRAWLLGAASRPQNSSQGFNGDPDSEPERVLFLGAT